MNFEAAIHAFIQRYEGKLCTALAHLIKGAFGIHELEAETDLREIPVQPTQPGRQVMESDVMAGDQRKLATHFTFNRR